MDKFVIKGGRPLTGAIPISGSKNSALPALAAALLSSEPVILRRIPKVRDIRTMQRLLVDVGAKVEVTADFVRIETAEITSPEARSEEHTSELQSHSDLVCRLLLEKKK